MQTYKAPLRDMRFVLHELIDAGQLAKLPGFEEATPDMVDSVLEEGAKLCEEVLLPLNRSGDEHGCTYENGVVRTPPGFKEAYKTFVEGGWLAVSATPDHGGQGLPELLSFVFDEMVCATNLGFGVCPLLSKGAMALLETHGSEQLKKLYLPRLADGRWSGTMCLTEPHCGTDLGLIKTKALPTDRGTYRVSGTKIFISAGEHDMSENIVHLVLAKLPNAPSGTRGISLFLVPKLMPKADGAPGARNGVTCSGIEKKMGIHASATCVLNFEDAEGWLVGEPHGGLRVMFTMMNAARLGVGLQGLGIGEIAYQSAVAYAKERRQGRALAGATEPAQPADPIIVHPDVRRMLLTQRALNEGARALGYLVALNIDLARRHPDADKRLECDEFVQLMTPIVKAFFTDCGSLAANLAVQIHGGHGYIREHGMEQLVRDSRIPQIYEGTNGIQALDLVGRKLGQNYGRLLRRFFHPAEAFVADNKDVAGMAEFIEPLAKGLERLRNATLSLAGRAMADPEEAGAAATDYLKLFALVSVGYMWARMAKVALEKRGEADAFYDTKLKTARFYFSRLMPETGSLFATVMGSKKSLMEMTADEF
ncbi:MAG: acyl-CoA dehydrogenase [Alphaproteobacteria bacterium]|nr:acyl-CoA dehydrogenase [Alphaproteobacteria bacterium]